MGLIQNLFKGKKKSELEFQPISAQTPTDQVTKIEIAHLNTTGDSQNISLVQDTPRISSAEALEKLDIAGLIESANSAHAAFVKSSIKELASSTSDKKMLLPAHTQTGSPLLVGSIQSQVVNLTDTPVTKESLPLPDYSIHYAAESTLSVSNQLELEKNYENLKLKTDISDVLRLISDLENIAKEAKSLHEQQSPIDGDKESWADLLKTLEEFLSKKLVLQEIELQLHQTIDQMRDIHQRIFESFDQIKVYETQRQENYKKRLILATDLEKKISLFNK